MFRHEFIKSLQEGMILTNMEMGRLFKDADGEYTFTAPGICARAEFMTESENDPTIVHFQRYIEINERKVPILKFTVSTEHWEVK